MTSKSNSDLKPEGRQPEGAASEEQASASSLAPEAGNEQEAEIFAKEIAENESEAASAVEPETEAVPPAPAHLERLQKILAAAGVASRRHAEELITQGRVEVNGKVVTALGTKADAARDHIRVDGKLLHGAERLRYFVLNKPKGYVTTVTDPEGRPTVMEFFKKMKERLYPVGRLDYMSEGLLVVTNDGELANRLTRAAAGIEKVYLVKVAGQPTEDELDRLRTGGVAIDRGRPGSEKVETAPAALRQVRLGDNPWFEVVLIEGRNRELRKMFEQIGHHVEKIRRVGYGPLVLDLEPGHVRELDAEEIDELRAAAEGKLRAPGSRSARSRSWRETDLPTVTPRSSRPGPRHAGGRSTDFFTRKPAMGGKKPFHRMEDREARPPRSDGRQEGRFPAAPPRPAPAANAGGRFGAVSGPQGKRGPGAGRGAYERPFAKRSAGAETRVGRRDATQATGSRSGEPGARPGRAGGSGWKAKPFQAKPHQGKPYQGKPYEAKARQAGPHQAKSFPSKPHRGGAAKPASGARAASRTGGSSRPAQRPAQGPAQGSTQRSAQRPARRPTQRATQRADGRHPGRSGAKRGGPRPGGKPRR